MTPYLTKVWVGRHWWYLDTSKKYKQRNVKILGRWIGVVSYAKTREQKVRQ